MVWGILLGLGVASWAGELDALVAKIQQAYEQTPALSAEFVQVTTLSALNRQQTSSGRLYLAKPHYVRWEYTAPEAQTVLYDGETLQIYTPRRKQVLRSAVPESERTGVALLFLAGVGKLQEAFVITPLPTQEAGREWLRLEPRMPQAGFTELHIAVNAQTSLIEQLRILDPIGNVTEIRLSAVQRHASLPARTFALTLPPDTEILTPADIRGPR
ncbi:MAG: hypothetical protein KatS3mg131_2880 [Candidatus Tectimicrobiota bacterium]|nr:MAG: hypothetical protein KatS3mg131_2880 [Candidatus Tectomicrobia bacterium]